jgi:hypothetical protein
VCEVDILGLFREELDFSPGIFIALFEGLEGGGCIAFEAEGCGYSDPIDLEGGAPLEVRRVSPVYEELVYGVVQMRHWGKDNVLRLPLCVNCEI